MAAGLNVQMSAELQASIELAIANDRVAATAVWRQEFDAYKGEVATVLAAYKEQLVAEVTRFEGAQTKHTKEFEQHCQKLQDVQIKRLEQMDGVVEGYDKRIQQASEAFTVTQADMAKCIKKLTMGEDAHYVPSSSGK